MVALRVDPYPEKAALEGLWREAFGAEMGFDSGRVLERSLVHIGAYEGERLVGFVHVAWDGGVHGFLLDTCVVPRLRRQGIGEAMVRLAAERARAGGAQWLHVDYEAHNGGFYARCGFRPTAAGLIAL